MVNTQCYFAANFDVVIDKTFVRERHQTFGGIFNRNHTVLRIAALHLAKNFVDGGLAVTDRAQTKMLNGGFLVKVPSGISNTPIAEALPKPSTAT